MKLHNIRHTFAKLILIMGQSPVYVKDQLGHSSIHTTVDIYGYLLPSSNRRAVNQLDSKQPSATYPKPTKIEKP
jgi:integrase